MCMHKYCSLTIIPVLHFHIIITLHQIDLCMQWRCQGKTPMLEGKCWKLNKKEQNKQVLTSWLRGSDTLNKLAKGGGGLPRVLPLLPPLLQYTLCCSSEFGSSLKPGSTLIFHQELREYPIQFTTYHRRTPPPPRQSVVRRLMKYNQITKLMSKTFNSTIETPILSKRGSFREVPDPNISCKKVSLSRPPLLPLQWISRWCKECPLTQRVNWIIAHNYGEPKCIFTKSTFSWKGKIFEPDIVWHNVL